jgi:hypothetical protein
MPINWGTSETSSWGKIKSLAGTLAIPASVALAPVLAKAIGIEIDPQTLEGQVSTATLAMAAGTAYTAAALQQNVKANDLVEQRRQEESEANRLANHDIAKAIGKTIATIIALQVGKQSQNSPWLALAKNHEATWVTIANTESLDKLGMLQDARILEAIQNNPDKPAFDAVGDEAFWREILALMARHAQVDPATLAAAPEYAAVIAALDTRFCYEFYQVLKQDATDGGRAFPGIMLRGMGRALVYLERIEKRQADHGARLDNITRLLHDVIDKLAATAGTNPAGDYTVFRAWLAAANRNTAALNANTTALERGTQATDTLTQALHANTAAQLGKAAPWPTDNLSAANVPNNFARFKGRIEDLDELHRRVLTDPPGLPIPIIGVPGLGKTAFVTRYVFLHQAQFDHVWWLRASNPVGASATSAEERSLAALLDILGGDSKAVQEEPGHARIDLLAQQVRTRLALPKPDGTTRKHLVILDNVDQYATIARLRLTAPSRVLYTARSANLARDGAVPLNFGALTPADGLQVLTSKVKQWNPQPHHDLLRAIGGLVGWNALALTYLAVVLGRRKTALADARRELLEPLHAALTAAAAEGNTAVIPVPGELDRPTEYERTLAEAFDQFIGPFAGKPEMQVLDAAAWCHADDIPLTLLRDASGLAADAFDVAADALIEAGVLELDGEAVNIHRLTQISIRGAQRARSEQAKSTALFRLLDALIELFRWPATQAEQLLDHTKTPARLAAVAHAEAAIVHAGTFVRDAGEGAVVPHPRTPTPARPEAADDLGAEVALLRGELSKWFTDVGMLAVAETHLTAAIVWGEAQSQRDERSLAILYASRARIRRLRERPKEAGVDLAKAIIWYEAQSPRDERGLAILYGLRARIRQSRGLLKKAEEDIAKSITWGEAQSPRDERSLAIDYASRASIRQSRGLLKKAEEDIAKSITWGEAQSPRDERGLAIWYASQARIWEAQAIAARKTGDVKETAALLAKAKGNIAAALTWWEKSLPLDERGLGILRRDQARIDKAAEGE